MKGAHATPSEAVTAPDGAAVAAAARGWIGTPFRHRASVRGAGADCLGLVRGLWRAFHGSEPRALPCYAPGGDAAEDERLWQGLAAILAPAAASGPGVVLLFRLRRGLPARHVGVQTGAAAFVHVYARHGVVESPLAGPWARGVVARFLLAPVGFGGVAPVGASAATPRIFLHR